MDAHTVDYERTLKIASAAVQKLKRLDQPLCPTNFERWYNYSSGEFPSLQEMIDKITVENGVLTEIDIESIDRKYYPHRLIEEQSIDLATSLSGKITELHDNIHRAIGTTAKYVDGLTEARGNFESGHANLVKDLIQQLHFSAAEMQEANLELLDRLTSSKDEIGKLQRDLEKVRRQADTDPLTSLANRQKFFRELASALTATQVKRSRVVMMVDIDHFKKVNDRFGHLIGDQVICLVANTIQQQLQGSDLVARFGGEEFVALIIESDLSSACGAAERIRRSIAEREVKKRSTGEMLGRVTVSIGVTELRAGDDEASVVERADACLYEAKRGGRNRVIASQPGRSSGG